MWPNLVTPLLFAKDSYGPFQLKNHGYLNLKGLDQCENIPVFFSLKDYLLQPKKFDFKIILHCRQDKISS